MKKYLLPLFLCLSLALTGHGQAGSIDLSFNPDDVGYGKGDGANNTVNSIAVQPDGKILVAGYFEPYNGTTINRIARLAADGTLDHTFNLGTGEGTTS